MNRIGRLISVLLLLVGCSFSLAAEGDGDSESRHTIRLGWGDMLFETAAYYPTVTHVYENVSGIPNNLGTKERFGHWYTGHIFAEYQYRISDVLSVGGQLDFEGLGWKSAFYDKNHKMLQTAPDSKFYNLVIMPTLQLAYYRKEPVTIYSGIGAGVLLSMSQSVEAAFAANLNLVGVQIGKGNWSGSVELGLLNAFNGNFDIYMLCSRIVSVSLNYSW